MPNLPEGILELIAKFLTPEEEKNFSGADKEIQKQLLSTIFLKLYQQHQETYPDQSQDSDEEQAGYTKTIPFQFDEDEKKQSAQRESFAKLVEIFSTIKGCDFLAIRDLESQDLMKAIKAEIEARENPNRLFLCRSSSASSLASQKSQEK